MKSHKCKEGVFESFFLSFVCVWKLAPDEHTQDVNTAVFPGSITSIANVWTSVVGNMFLRALFSSFVCLWKLAPVGSRWSKLGHVCTSLGRSWCIPGAYPFQKSILARFAQCWGSLEPFRGGMLEVIGAVGSRSGLCWRLCCCYVYFFAAMLVHLAAFPLLLDLGRWSFA